jgi:hypothetical protein
MSLRTIRVTLTMINQMVTVTELVGIFRQAQKMMGDEIISKTLNSASKHGHGVRVHGSCRQDNIRG